MLEKYENCSIDWLTSLAAKPVLLNIPIIRQIFTWEERSTVDSYDLVIGLEDSLDVCRFVAEVKSMGIVGAYTRDNRIAYTPSGWFDMSLISKFGLETANSLKKRNGKTYQQHMSELLGISVNNYFFNLAPEEIEYGQKFVKNLGITKTDKVVGINTGAGKRWPLKSLSVEKTIELVNKLKRELGLVSIILGGADEKERNAIICHETGMPNGGVHSIRNFAAVVNQCQVLVCSDSLAMHFGIALGKKLVVFFGPTSATEIELYGLGTKLLAKVNCAVCYKKSCDSPNTCMDVLGVNELVAAAKNLL
ncbi:hypothetical protein A2291_02475 [candidate division WOR-1 bacterium RIFOXYB2_FULL_42_35]|uniref:Heptosyltransferase n=1 Tax=candidate division WOR-1 bacterium RIFOXYC2_FULL_41_25 TaxID=1802586 RepID=A0A1F4TPH5_UNCSA|nr:MAG: hypothetical protein A2247_05380 [candidate division WOR-1 bacterium RIFOXYA2_FULL_41_14]OGC25089.1 MAG: hypothetical protein A2291_02475 [candidate division WOR-1 bacterium RIFOXYB2_FULL_42_35]OGC34489.1 MAG: hypothetical protein A2462_04295 [candidate division WOR-1 bacterium RIFOXYC2_FULL_41_25]